VGAHPRASVGQELVHPREREVDPVELQRRGDGAADPE
jgi:hypothetical protein